MLGAAGATVYCTGRSVRGQVSDIKRSETIDDTADMVTARGGIGIAVQCDHTVEEQVKALFERVREEQQGRLDILVNDIWGGENLTHWNIPFWEQFLSDGLLMQERAVTTHMITSYYGVPLMVDSGGDWSLKLRMDLRIGIAGTCTTAWQNFGDPPGCCHGGRAASLSGNSAVRYTRISAFRTNAGSLWRDGRQLAGCRSAGAAFHRVGDPYFLAQGIAALAADPNVADKSGKALSSWDLSDEYGFSDIDGRRPHWGNYAKQQGLPLYKRKGM